MSVSDTSAPGVYLHPLAHLKIALHAVKYPHCSCNGVLLGSITSTSSSGSSKGGKGGNGIGDWRIEVVDAIPLLHHWTGLSPMMEAALEIVTQHLSTPPESSKTIVGFYQGNSRLDDLRLDVGGGTGRKVAEAVASRLRAGGKDGAPGLAFVVDNQALGSPSHAAILPYTSSPHSPTTWTSHPPAFPTTASTTSPFKLISPTSPPLISKAVRSHLHRKIFDWDDHLEAIEADWPKNSLFAEGVKELQSSA